MQNQLSFNHHPRHLKKYAVLMSLIFTLLLIATPTALAEESTVIGYELGVKETVISGSSSITLTLTNNTDQTVELAGPINVAVLADPPGNDILDFPIETLSTANGDVILGGQASIALDAGNSVEIAVIAPGMPDTWRPHTTADAEVIISAYLRIDGVEHHTNHAELRYEPVTFNPGLKLETNSPLYYPDDEYYGIEIWLVNESTSDITIEGPMVVQGTDQWHVGTDQVGQHRVSLSLEGAAPITISAGTRVLAAEVEPGPPGTWRQLYSPKIVPVKVWVHVTDSQDGDGIWASATETFAIVGDASAADGISGRIVRIADQLDGTAAITVRVNQAGYINIVTDDNGQYEHIFEETVFSDQFVNNMKKADFSIAQMTTEGNHLVGDLLSVQTTGQPGEYILIWSYQDGTHQNIIVDGAPPGTDFFTPFLTDVPQDATERLTVTISSLARSVEQTYNDVTGLYEGTLVYPSASITFKSEQALDTVINLRQKGSTARPLPEDGPRPAGLYYDINVASGSLSDATILLEIKYSLDDIPENMSEKDLKLFRYNETSGVWDLLPDQEIDLENKIIRVLLTGFSEFGVFEDTSTEPAGDADQDDAQDEPAAGENDQEFNPDTGSGSEANRIITIWLLAAALLLAGLSIFLKVRKNQSEFNQND